MTPEQVKAAADRAERTAGQTIDRKTGRPSGFTKAIGDAICEKIADGESLRKICEDPTMPNKATVFRWLADDAFQTFRDQYALARESQADTFADEIVQIADDATDPQKARVQIDARKWVAGKMRPKKYGDRQTIEHEGEIATRKVTDLTDDELAHIAAGGRAGSSAAPEGSSKPH